jgi:hypothetical protein
MKRMTYVVNSHWSGQTSRLNGTRYPSLVDALGAIGSEITEGEWWSDTYGVEARECSTTGVYSSEEDRDANNEGGAPHRMMASVSEIYGEEP